MIRLQFRFQHGCAVNRISKEFPEVTMTEWCNQRMHYLELGTDNAGVIRSITTRLREARDSTSDRIRTDRAASNAPSIVMRCRGLHTSLIPRILDRNSVILLYPIVYREGWEHYRAQVLDHQRLPHLIAALSSKGRIEVTQKRPTRGVGFPRSLVLPSEEILADLTDRQRHALLRSIEAGYFDIPRRAALDEIARGTGVPRTTFGEHLQKAEGKLLRALAPYLALNVS
jgi:predicted DNA binding protein